MGEILDNINRNGVINPINRYAVLFNNGNIIEVEAVSYEWDEDDQLLRFYDTPEEVNEGNKIATFKIDTLYGVAMLSNTVMHDLSYSSEENKILMIPCYVKGDKDE